MADENEDKSKAGEPVNKPAEVANKEVPAATGNEVKRKAGWRRTRIIAINIAIFTIVAVLIIWLTRNFFHLDEDNYTNDAQVQAFVNPINTKVSGYINKILFSDFQNVKRGDTLVILDSSEMVTQVGQAQAALDNTRAAKASAQISVQTAANDLSVDDANIAGAKAKMLNAEQTMKRYKNLLDGEAVSQQQYDEEQTDYQSLKAQYESLISQRKSSSLSTQEAASKIASNNADIEKARYALESAKLNLSYSIITAPTDGVLGKRSVNVGQLLQTGQQVATIVTNDARWVIANYREKQMSLIKPGKLVKITVDALGGKEYQGKITQVAPATGSSYSTVPVDNSTGNFVKVQQRIPVKIEFTNANSTEDLKLLGAGMNVVVTINE